MFHMRLQVGVSENSVPHCTQWLMIIIPIKWLFHWEYTLFSDKPKSKYHNVSVFLTQGPSSFAATLSAAVLT